MIARILVPHDGTEMSNKAFQRAIEFAKAFNAEIILLHVIQVVPIPASLLSGNDRVLISRAKRSIAKELEKGWNKMVQEKINNKTFIPNNNNDVRSKVRWEMMMGSSPGEEIVKFAKNNQIDMIIMGSKRLEAISKFKALGSVARKVSEASECPVMLVH